MGDDNYTNQKVIQLFLMRLGCTADIVSNGLDAITAWESNNYDLILMDIHMPDLDGINATASIRKKEILQNRQPCQIVALTADALTSTVTRCMEAGMNGFLTKPIHPDALRDILIASHPILT